MKKIFRAALLASTLSLAAAAAVAQDSNSSAPQQQRDAAQSAEKEAKQQRPKTGTDCSNRPGARCSKPKQRKPWFFGKA
jgi:uncharacterized low-complexity protein